MNVGESLNIPEHILSFVVNIDDFKFYQELNEGNFEIWHVIEKSSGKSRLAKKYYLKDPSLYELHDYYQEVINLSQIENPFVTSFVGFTVKYPYCILIEYLNGSNLYEEIHLYKKSYPFTGTLLTTIAMGIAYGMSKLHENNITIPYFSSSNIYLNSEFMPKICLFNISSKPLKWKAPERVYKSDRKGEKSQEDYFKSDVYAFAFILHELLTRKDVFRSMSTEKAIHMVCVENKRPSIPKNTNPKLKNLIKTSWSSTPSKRPSFNEIYSLFEAGEVHFPHTNRKSIEAFVRRIRNFERSIINNNKMKNYVKKQVLSQSLSPISKKSQFQSHRYQSKVMTPNQSYYRYRKRRNEMEFEDSTENPNGTFELSKLPIKRRSNSETKKVIPQKKSSNVSSSYSNEYEASINEDQSSDNSYESIAIESPSPTKNKKSEIDQNSPSIKSSIKNVNLNVFQNINNPEFCSALQNLPNSIEPSQYRQFFKIISKYFTSECPLRIVLLIFEVIQKLFQDHEAINAFINLSLYRYLPIDDKQLINSTFDILYALFDYSPEIFQLNFSSQMSLLIMKNPEKSLTLLSLFAKSFNEIRNPWSLLDLLFKYETVFFKSNVGSEYISLLFFMNFTFTVFYQERIAASRPIFVRFLDSSDKNAVIMAYRAICALFDDLFQIPLDIIAQDLTDSGMFLYAISVMLRMKDSDLIPELRPQKNTVSLNDIVNILVKIAENRFEATFVLLRMLKSIEVSKIMLMNPSWLLKELPSIQDTLKIFLSIMMHASLRDFISNIDILPKFLNMLINSNDKACMISLKSIITRLNLTKEAFQKLVDYQFFPNILNSFSVYNDEKITACTLNILSYLATKEDCAEYWKFGDRLKLFIWNKNIHISHAAFDCLYAMSFFPLSACRFKQMKLNEDVIEIFNREKDIKKVSIFVKNLEKAKDV